MLCTGVPRYALDELHRRSRSERRKSRSLSRGRDSVAEKPQREDSRSRSRGRGNCRDHDRIREGEYKDHVPSKHDFTVKTAEKNPTRSRKELKSIMKHKDSRIFFDDVKGPYYALNTFSDHPVVYDGFTFHTAEHLLFYFRVS